MVGVRYPVVPNPKIAPARSGAGQPSPFYQWHLLRSVVGRSAVSSKQGRCAKLTMTDCYCWWDRAIGYPQSRGIGGAELGCAAVK